MNVRCSDLRAFLSPLWAPLPCPGLQDFFTRELKPGARPVDSPEERGMTSWLIVNNAVLIVFATAQQTSLQC